LNWVICKVVLLVRRVIIRLFDVTLLVEVRVIYDGRFPVPGLGNTLNRSIVFLLFPSFSFDCFFFVSCIVINKRSYKCPINEVQVRGKQIRIKRVDRRIY